MKTHALPDLRRPADFTRLEKALRREKPSKSLPQYDLFSNIIDTVLTAYGRKPLDCQSLSGPARHEAETRNKIEYMSLLGYDYVDLWQDRLGFFFTNPPKPSAETTEGSRHYITSHDFCFSDRAGLKSYPWPDPEKGDYGMLDRVATILPPGMKIILSTRGILETTMDLLGHENICYLLYDDPDLVGEVFRAVGERYLRFFELGASHPAIGAVTYCDDMGFKTQTLLPPDVYRQHLFPWHKRINEVAHRAGKPTILHACGNLDKVMEDIIACGWDAKQSFEDNIEPIWEAKRKYGDRIALLGGFDVDKLCRMTEKEIRAHTRMLMERCGRDGGFALGTGNSVPNYIPVTNFLAMLDEGRRCNK